MIDNQMKFKHAAAPHQYIHCVHIQVHSAKMQKKITWKLLSCLPS